MRKEQRKEDEKRTKKSVEEKESIAGRGEDVC